MAYCTCVPTNYKLTPIELLNDFKRLKVKAVIVPYAKLIDTEVGSSTIICFRRAGLQLIGLNTTCDTDIAFTLVEDPVVIDGSSNEKTIAIADSAPLNKANNVVLLIQTSGTTGQRKIVPYRLQTLCISTICVIFSVGINDTDTIINMMPLFHVGGIVRTTLTPLFSGGSTVQCQGFDPVQFCDILEHQTGPIWFYGVPSMQQSILREVSMRKLPSKCCDKVKKICNAGVALSPELAKEIKATFSQAAVLPSYGMTECMPICAPPVNYGLELDGTSGQVVGPELAISVNNENTLADNVVGHILVRGSPLFDGYEDVDDAETFDKDGFFDTGDMGYLKNGYVYVTGRSKEVINRGGEIISPLEIENALLTHPKVAQAMAFSVPHQALQETVGCAIVPRNPFIRPDLRSLRTFLENKLHSSKHPAMLVYMNDIPKNNVGKVLRMNFSSRLNIPCVTTAEEASPVDLLYEGHCTTDGNVTSFRAVKWLADDVVELVKKHPQVQTCAAYRNAGNFHLFVINMHDDNEGLVSNIKTYLQSTVHDYMLPTDIIIVPHNLFEDWESIDERNLANLVKQQQRTTDDPVTLVLCDIFGLVIGMHKDNKFPENGNFFDYGGDSLKAGIMSSLLRTKLGVTLSTSTFYEESGQTPVGLAAICRELMPNDHKLFNQGYDKFRIERDDTDLRRTFNTSNYKKRMKLRPASGARNPFNVLVMLFQASPFYLMQPLARLLRWIIFVHVSQFTSFILRETLNVSVSNFVCLLLTLVLYGICFEIIFPIIGILMKWLVIGRYRVGTYPLWGVYYLRWWFVNKLLSVTDVGIFKMSPTLFVLYLRMMGAKVGFNSRVSFQADIHEFDLIDIGSDCYLDNCIMRPFVLSRGHMNLSKIVLRDSCVIGLLTNVVAGTCLPNGTVVGPQTTTYARDLKSGNGSTAHKDTAEGIQLRDLCRETIPDPHFLLEYVVGWSVIALTQMMSHIPWFYCLYLLTTNMPITAKTNIAELTLHFANPTRIGYFLLAKIVRLYVVCLLYTVFVIFIKRFIIGEFKAGPRSLDQLSLFRYWLMKTLLPIQKMEAIATIVGSHYELVSVIYRLLGAKVGKRVYWPGSNINIVEFDLLTVGNDVVFGSKSHILCGDAKDCAAVTIEDGAMCADNCVLLPGSRIGRSAILGTGGLLKKGFQMADGSIWYGSYNGNAVTLRDGNIRNNKISSTVPIGDKYETMEASNATSISVGNCDQADTMRPFGRAFYERKANYFVFPLSFVIVYNAFFIFLGVVLWSFPFLAALRMTAYYIHSAEVVVGGTTVSNPQHEAFTILIFFGFISIFNVSVSVFTIFLEIIAKWTLIGRRKEGKYKWYTSSYCQRWQMLIPIQRIGRANTLSCMCGSAWILLFVRAMGGKID